MGKPDSTLGGLRYEPLRRRRRTAQRALARALNFRVGLNGNPKL